MDQSWAIYGTIKIPYIGYFYRVLRLFQPVLLCFFTVSEIIGSLIDKGIQRLSRGVERCVGEVALSRILSRPEDI